jgi:hypothetical protein
MSNILVPFQTIEAIANAMYFAANNPGSGIHAYKICQKLTKENIENHASNWHNMNLDSFFDKNDIGPEFKKPTFRLDQPPANPVQLLRWIELLDESISKDLISANCFPTGSEMRSLVFLNHLRMSVMVNIVHNLPEYKSAKGL